MFCFVTVKEKKLILFDVDGTLVLYKERIPSTIFEGMAREFFGVSISLDSYRFSGKTDKAITYETLALGGIPDAVIERHEAAIFEWIPNELARRTSPDSLGLLPNVDVLLDAIDGKATKGLLTGNIERCAEIKLSQFGLMRHFKFGVYGTESKNRNDLGPIALRKYHDFFGEAMHPGNVIIIGDAINDIQVAKHIGAKSIVTLTGRTTRDEVEAYKPDFIFENLCDTNAVLDAIYA